MNNYNKRSLNTEVVLTKYKREREREGGKKKKGRERNYFFYSGYTRLICHAQSYKVVVMNSSGWSINV